MATLSRQRIRIAADAGRFDPPLDILRQATPALWRGSDIQFEIGIYQNAQLTSIENLTSITLEVRPAGDDGSPANPSVAPSFAKTLGADSLNTSLQSADWINNTQEHARFAFTAAETAVPAGDYWLSLHALTNDTPGRLIVLTAGALTVYEQGAGLTSEPSPAASVFYTAEQSDTRFALLEDAFKSEAVTAPAGFSWEFTDFSIYRQGETYTVGWNGSSRSVQGLRPAWFNDLNGGNVYYVGFDGASNSNSGLSPDASMKSLNEVFDIKTDFDVIVLADSLYDRADSWSAGSPIRRISRDCTIIGLGNCTLSQEWGHTTGSWTQDTTTTVHYAARSVVVSVWDKRYPTTDGDYAQLTKAADIAACRAQPGSWFLDVNDDVGNGTNQVYVHPLDGRVPDSDITLFLNESNGYVLGGTGTIYIENVRFYGGNGAFQVFSDDGDRPRVVFVNCEFKYSNTNGLDVNGAREILCINCVAAHNGLDGLNYHLNGSDAAPDVLEVNCRSYLNGWDDTGSDICNASTMHDGGRIIRVGGVYERSVGPVVTDVNDDTESWNLGVTAHSSLATNTAKSAAFYASNALDMWLDGCKAADCTSFISANNGASVHLRRTRSGRTTNNAATVDSY